MKTLSKIAIYIFALVVTFCSIGAVIISTVFLGEVSDQEVEDILNHVVPKSVSADRSIVVSNCVITQTSRAHHQCRSGQSRQGWEVSLPLSQLSKIYVPSRAARGLIIFEFEQDTQNKLAKIKKRLRQIGGGSQDGVEQMFKDLQVYYRNNTLLCPKGESIQINSSKHHVMRHHEVITPLNVFRLNRYLKQCNSSKGSMR